MTVPISTQSPIFNLLAIFIIFQYFSLVIITNAQSDSVSFIYSSSHNLQDIVFSGDATSSGDTIHLTTRDEHGNPLPHSVGRAVYSQPVHIWDAATWNLADFTTVFYFSVNRSETAMEDNKNDSSSSSKLEFGAVEFDSFANQWDPNPFSEYPHVGINVNSLRSVTTVGWPRNYFEPDGATVKARVRYDSGEKELMVMVSYPDSINDEADCLTHIIDLRRVLAE
ncbi:hypothetical protein K1719_003771 [Acacia pycnantha]|nr:hypothetical protein K1719_003771 [Acacia pycnantha]